MLSSRTSCAACVHLWYPDGQPLEHLLRLRFSFLAIVNLLLHRCVYVADTSMTGGGEGSVGAMLKRWNHLLFTDTKVGTGRGGGW